MLFLVRKKLIQSIEKQIDGVELRLDAFDSIDLSALKSYLTESPFPVLFTLRKESHGGFYKGAESEREALMEKLFSLGPAFFDLEYDMSASFIEKMVKAYPQTKILLSYHNFTDTPELEALFKKMQAAPVYAYKIATMAHSTLDALRMIAFVRKMTQQGQKMIGICMGKEGAITRILGPISGNIIDYAPEEEEEATAPGQMAAKTLLETYHYKNLHFSTPIFALIGDPVDKSLSHLSHNGVMQGKDGVYVKMRVLAEELPAFFSYIRQLPFKGLSVTMPLKEEVAPYLDELTLDAKAIGAVNTIVFKEERLIGANTDAPGALDALEERGTVLNKKIAIIGAGGTARAVAYEAKKRGAKVYIYNRTEKRAEEIAKDLGCFGFGLDQLADYEILINTTSVGMSPNLEQMPINPSLILPGKIVMDAIFSPKKTKLLKEAEAKQCTLVYGYELFINQAARQFALWLNKDTIKVKKILNDYVK